MIGRRTERISSASVTGVAPCLMRLLVPSAPDRVGSPVRRKLRGPVQAQAAPLSANRKRSKTERNQNQTLSGVRFAAIRVPKDGTERMCCKTYDEPAESGCCEADRDSTGPEGVVVRVSASKRAFRVVLIKPSHYDADGYVIQWWRSTLPSNSLASVYGLVEQCARERVLGPDIDIEVEACDECNTIVDVAAVARRIRAHLISAGNSAPTACQWSWAVSTFRAASPCCRNCRRTLRKPSTWGSPSSPARPRTAWPKSCAMSPLARQCRSTNFSTTFRK